MPTGQPGAPTQKLRRRWDTPKALLLCAGIYLLVLSALAQGSWWPLGTTIVASNLVIFGVLAVVVMVLVHRASLDYVTGRWGRIGLWLGVIVAAFAVVLAATHLAGSALPEELTIFIPRLLVAVLGVVAVLGGLLRGADDDEDEDIPTGDEWFTQTSRILQARQLWTHEQAREQMRVARSEFDHEQARRAPGAPELQPVDVLGTPEEYAAAQTAAPRVTSDPIQSGRWYYLLTALVLGGWALYRTMDTGNGWITAALWLFSVVALAMFMWASWIVYRHR